MPYELWNIGRKYIQKPMAIDYKSYNSFRDIYLQVVQYI